MGSTMQDIPEALLDDASAANLGNAARVTVQSAITPEPQLKPIVIHHPASLEVLLAQAKEAHHAWATNAGEVELNHWPRWYADWIFKEANANEMTLADVTAERRLDLSEMGAKWKASDYRDTVPAGAWGASSPWPRQEKTWTWVPSTDWMRAGHMGYSLARSTVAATRDRKSLDLILASITGSAGEWVMNQKARGFLTGVLIFAHDARLSSEEITKGRALLTADELGVVDALPRPV